jgi:putative methyltransferase (TIGR04325 family)
MSAILAPHDRKPTGTLMKHAYCTYFDHNYLPRALLMLRSLQSCDPGSTIFVIALSDLCHVALKRLALPNVTVVALAELERVYPELLDVKLERTPIEYIFTLTPVLPLYVFGADPAIERVTYVDADLYFFSSPQPLLDATEKASVAITPHNFSPDRHDKIVYGRFNVGWMTYRRCPEGLDCLETYKANCLAWCYDRIEGDRFADQKYLDAWPGAYPNHAIITHKGVNTALWNADNYVFTERDGKFFADGDPLVCYHFTSIRIESDGSFVVPVPDGHRASESPLIRHIIRPYVARLMRERTELHRRFPALAAAEFAGLRYRGPETRPRSQPWKFVGRSWPTTAIDPLESDSATSSAIALYFNLETSAGGKADSLLGQIIARVAKGKRRISVLDWRGGVGHGYLVAQAAAPEMAFDWHVFEAPAYCDYGRVINTAVHFHEIPAPMEDQGYDLVFVRGTLGLDPDWRQSLARLAQATKHALLLGPVIVHPSGSFVATNHPPQWRDGAGLNTWIIGEQDLKEAAASTGLKIVGEVSGPPMEAFPEMPGQATARIIVLSREG